MEIDYQEKELREELKNQGADDCLPNTYTKQTQRVFGIGGGMRELTCRDYVSADRS